MIAVPTALMILPRYVLDNTLALNRFAPEFIGVFPFVIMFIVAAATTQRERARGTLERLMAMLLASSTCWSATRSRSGLWPTSRSAWCWRSH
jgi:hypothetical protein